MTSLTWVASGLKAGLQVEGTFTNRLKHTGRVLHGSTLYRGSTNSPKIHKQPHNSRRQTDDILSTHKYYTLPHTI